MADAGAEVVKARPWRRVAATAVDSACLALAVAPGLMLIALSSSPVMTVAGVVLIGLLPLGAHFVAFAALGNMPGGWLFGVRIRRIPGVQVGAAGHLVRWTHIGWQSTVIGLIALVVILPAFLAIKALTGGSPVPLAAEWKGVTLRIWVAPFTAAFLIYNLWRMAHADRGRTTWDVMTGTCAVHERREGPAAVPPVSQASGERTLR